jgi:hypothetical protein
MSTRAIIQAIGDARASLKATAPPISGSFMEVLEIQEARRSGTVPTANPMVPGIWAGKP